MNNQSLFYSLLKNIDTNISILNGKILFSKSLSKKLKSEGFDIKIDNFNNFSYIFKSLKKPFNYNSLYNLYETIDFRYNVLKNLSKLNYNIKLNLDQIYLKFLFLFSKNKPFKIVELDKNVGSALISNELYDKLVLDSLSNNESYLVLEYNPLNIIYNEIKNNLEILKNKSYISEKLFKYLQVDIDKVRLGSYRLLPKIHKEKFSCRPIINCKNHVTSFLSMLINLLLQPHVQFSSSYIKDSQDLILKTKDLYIPNDSILFSFDFESLYSNILLDSLISLICDFIKPFFVTNHISIQGFHCILEMVLLNNVFSYKNQYYKQIKGIAMGTICGPTLANLYLSILEKHCVTLPSVVK